MHHLLTVAKASARPATLFSYPSQTSCFDFLLLGFCYLLLSAASFPCNSCSLVVVVWFLLFVVLLFLLMLLAKLSRYRTHLIAFCKCYQLRWISPHTSSWQSLPLISRVCIVQQHFTSAQFLLLLWQVVYAHHLLLCLHLVFDILKDRLHYLHQLLHSERQWADCFSYKVLSLHSLCIHLGLLSWSLVMCITFWVL